MNDDLMVGCLALCGMLHATVCAARVSSVLLTRQFFQMFFWFPTNCGALLHYYAAKVHNWCNVGSYVALLITDTMGTVRVVEKGLLNTAVRPSSAGALSPIHCSLFANHFPMGRHLGSFFVQRLNLVFLFSYADPLIWYQTVRIGEASNPGPAGDWKLVVRNIVSADAHMDELRDTSANCIVWSETSATKPTQLAIKRQCKTVGATCTFSVPLGGRLLKGAPCFGRGSSSGVLIYTPVAKQLSISKSWSDVFYNTGRIADSLLYVSGRQIRVIAVYGYHSRVCDAEGLNSLLFHEVFQQAFSFSLPTLVVGDFNTDISSLDAWDVAVAKGFIDVAAHVAACEGRLPEPTYRGKSRLDYILANQAAMCHFHSFAQDPHGYTDHAVLEATFKWDSSPTYKCWNMPFDLASVPDLLAGMERSASSHDSGLMEHESAFQAFCHGFESVAKATYKEQTGRELLSKFLGRGRGSLVSRVAAPIVLSLNGEVAIQRHSYRKKQKCLRWLRELLWEVQRRQATHAHSHNLWKKIWSAKGFEQGFPTWLINNDFVDYVPIAVPPLEWLQHVVQALTHDEEHWCQEIRRQRLQAQRTNMTLDFKGGGRLHAATLRGEKPAPLSTLPHRSELQVHPQKSSKGCNARYRIMDPNHCPIPGDIWQVADKTCVVQSCSDNIVTVTSSMSKGMYTKQVHQISWSLDPHFIASEVINYWNSWWNSDTPVDGNVLDPAINALPEIEPFDPVISIDELNLAIKTLPMVKARGLDGFSNRELKALSHPLRVQLLDAFHGLTRGDAWPSSLTVASVSLLAKTEVPKSAADARPITVLPTVFRLWSKIHTRKALTHVLKLLPRHLYGSVPGRAATDMAMHLQCKIEASLSEGTELTGFALDLAKAYNTIPREVLRCLMLRLGFPEVLVQSYCTFLGQLQRYLLVGNQLHGPLESIKGVPEGCPLAVISMILVTWMVSASTEKHTSISMSSYVDNWALQGTDTQGVINAVHHVQSLTTATTMKLSLEKSFSYSTSAKTRRVLRQTKFGEAHVPVAHSFKDLGVSFACIQRGTAAMFMTRIQKAEPKLQTLRLVGWPDYRKARALTRFVAPTILYGCELSSVSATVFRSLRGRFNSALWGRHSSRDHWLTPLLSADQVYDPFYLVLLHRLRVFKRWWAADQSQASEIWNVVLHTACKSPRGPVSYLMSQFKMLEWGIHEDGWVQIGPDRLHIWLHDLSFWKREALSSCGNLAIRRARQRQGFSLPPSLDVPFIRRGLSKGEYYNTLAANIPVGAVCSTDQKKHFLTDEAAVCQSCGRSDSIWHRIMECPACQLARDKADWPALSQADPTQLVGGLWERPPVLEELRNFFRQVPLIWAFRVFEDGVSLFTDGTADFPTMSEVSCASWAVTLAEPGVLDHTRVWGHRLHGCYQSNNRAELMAVIAAVMSADGGNIFTDSQIVYDGVLKIQAGLLSDIQWAKRCHFDLWLHLLDLKESLVNWSFFKVKSHTNWTFMDAGHEQWIAYQNDAVDRYVKFVNLTEWPQEFRALQRRAVSELQMRSGQQRIILDFHSDVAKCTVDTCKVARDSQKAMHAGVANKEAPTWDYLKVRVLCEFMPQGSIVKKESWCQSAAFASVLQDFLQQQRWVFHHEGISLLELYLLFVKQTGWHVPINVVSWNPFLIQGRFWSNNAPAVWIHETQHPPLRLHRQSLGKQLKTFHSILRNLVHYSGSATEIVSGAFLKDEGVRALVPGIFMRPFSSLDGATLAELRVMLAGGGLERLLRRAFSTKVQVIPCGIELIDPSVPWLGKRKALRRILLARQG